MYIKNKFAAIIWRAITVVVGTAGLIRGASLMPPGEFFYFFTGLSILAAVIYFAGAITAVVMIVAFIVLGYVLFALDCLLGKVGKKGK